MSSYEYEEAGIAYWRTMGLSPRASNALSKGGIYTLDQLKSLSRQELLRLPNLGSGSVAEIKEKLGGQEPVEALILFGDARLITELKKRGYTVRKNGKVVE